MKASHLRFVKAKGLLHGILCFVVLEFLGSTLWQMFPNSPVSDEARHSWETLWSGNTSVPIIKDNDASGWL